MNTVLSSTFFSAPPDWGWYIVFYFFFGGLAGGSYFLAVLIDLFGRPEDRPLARLGYYISFPCIVISGLLLTLDLGRPERFWHMLIQSNTYQPIFKPWSPMSVGSWALMIFGIFSLLAFLSALAEDGRWQRPAARDPAASRHARIDHRRDRRTLRFLRRRVYRSSSRRHQSSDLVGHASARHAVRGFGGVDIGGIDDTAGAQVRPRHVRR